MRSGDIEIDRSRLRNSSFFGYYWPSTASSKLVDGSSESSAYDFGFNVVTTYPSLGPTYRCLGFPLRCQKRKPRTCALQRCLTDFQCLHYIIHIHVSQLPYHQLYTSCAAGILISLVVALDTWATIPTTGRGWHQPNVAITLPCLAHITLNSILALSTPQPAQTSVGSVSPFADYNLAT